MEMKQAAKLMALLVITIGIVFVTVQAAMAYTESADFRRPFPVAGNVDVSGLKIQKVSVQVCNERTKYCAFAETNDKGDFLTDLGNFLVNDPYEPTWFRNDEISVKYCEGDDCTYKFKIGESKGDGTRCCKDKAVLKLKVYDAVPVSPVESNVLEQCRNDPVCSLELNPEVQIRYLDREVKVKELVEVTKSYSWGKKFLIMLLGALAGAGATAAVVARNRKKAGKAVDTVLRKHREGSYRKK